MDSLSNDIIMFIYNKLPFVYRVTFARAYCRIFRLADSSTRDFGKIIRDKINQIGLYIEFVDDVISAGGAITGGFLLDCLFDTNYVSDVDIIFDVGLANVISETPPNLDGDYSMSRFSVFHKIFIQRGAIRIEWMIRKDHNQNILNISNIYVFCNRCVKLIFTEPDKSRYINMSDFDFCKILYTGELIITDLISVLRKRSTYTASDDILCYSDYISCFNYKIHENTRADKYRDRGFTIDS